MIFVRFSGTWLATFYTTETHRHFDVAAFHLNVAVNNVEITVVVGNDATGLASNFVPHVIARAVPLSVISTMRTSPATGVPVWFVVIEVIA